MSKISFRIGERELFTFGKSTDHPSALLYVLSLLPGVSLFLLVIFGILSYFLPNDFIFSNFLNVLGVVALLSATIKFFITEGTFKLPKLTDGILVLLILSLVVSRIFTTIPATSLDPLTQNAFNVVNYLSLILLTSMVVLFRRNYFAGISRLMFLSVGFILVLKLTLDTIALFDLVVLQKITLASVKLTFLDLLTYMLSLGYLYLLLRGGYRRIVKVVTYILFVVALFFLSTLIRTSQLYSWVLFLGIVLFSAVMLVFNFSPVKAFVLKTVSLFKDKRYVSGAINGLLIVGLLAVIFGSLYFLYTGNNMDVNNLKSIFSYFTDSYKTGFSALRLVSGNAFVNAGQIWSLVGLNMGWITMLILLVLQVLPFVYLYRMNLKHKEAYVFFLTVLSVSNLIAGINLLSILVTIVMFVLLSGSSKEDTLKLKR